MSSNDSVSEAVIDLEDEEGNVLSFEQVLTFAYKDNFYIALTPTEPNDEIAEDEVVIMRLTEDGDDIIYDAIESDEELDEVWAEFEHQYYDE